MQIICHRIFDLQLISRSFPQHKESGKMTTEVWFWISIETAGNKTLQPIKMRKINQGLEQYYYQADMSSLNNTAEIVIPSSASSIQTSSCSHRWREG